MPQQNQETNDTLVLCVRPGGTIEGLYDDDLALHELGDIEIRRASSVEYDQASGEWVAATEDGTVIGRARRRAACILQEIRHFQAAFLAGFRPF